MCCWGRNICGPGTCVNLPDGYRYVTAAPATGYTPVRPCTGVHAGGGGSLGGWGGWGQSWGPVQGQGSRESSSAVWLVGRGAHAVPVDKANLNLGEAGLWKDHLRSLQESGSHPWAMEPRRTPFTWRPRLLEINHPSDWSSCCLHGRRKPDLLPPPRGHPGGEVWRHNT